MKCYHYFELFAKYVIILTLLACIVLLAAGCNKQIIDTTYKFDYAIISLPNGEIVEGKVQSWNDYEGDQIQVKINGATYLVHSMNVVLVKGTGG